MPLLQLHHLAALFLAWCMARAIGHICSHRLASRSFGDCPNAGVLWLHPFREPFILLARCFYLPRQIGHYFSGFDCLFLYFSSIFTSTLALFYSL
ncbi:hypothetical protein FB45DRAFT_470949 [Roridomyces roridus]|uniref:Secreted protein n=1 Tax=Roridomyces roridus TaxID=1738132 RepID=A0AAD7FNK5_9AGAR|nr:hypothetical protein FB45DRAFT_470949 [Roridomyces roridus]